MVWCRSTLPLSAREHGTYLSGTCVGDSEGYEQLGFSPTPGQPAAWAPSPQCRSVLSRQKLPINSCVATCLACVCISLFWWRLWRSPHIYCLLSFWEWHLRHYCLLRKFRYSSFFISLCLVSGAFCTSVQGCGRSRENLDSPIPPCMFSSGQGTFFSLKTWGMG